MNFVSPRAVFVAFGLCLALVGCDKSDLSAALGDPALDARLSEKEQTTAREIAEAHLKQTELYAAPIFFTMVELFRVKEPDGERSRDRRAVVSHYRYRGDLTIFTYVNLTTGKVIETQSTAHVPTPLSREEFENARELGLADATVKKLLGENLERVEVEPLVLRSSFPEDPIFGRRVVRLQFRVGRDYLREPVVIVDLTGKKVTVERTEKLC